MFSRSTSAKDITEKMDSRAPAAPSVCPREPLLLVTRQPSLTTWPLKTDSWLFSSKIVVDLATEPPVGLQCTRLDLLAVYLSHGH